MNHLRLPAWRPAQLHAHRQLQTPVSPVQTAPANTDGEHSGLADFVVAGAKEAYRRQPTLPAVILGCAIGGAAYALLALLLR